MRTTQQVCVVNVDWIDAARIFIPENGQCAHHAFNVDSALNTTPSMKTQQTHNHIIPYYHWTSPVCCTQCARSTHTHTHHAKCTWVTASETRLRTRSVHACIEMLPRSRYGPEQVKRISSDIAVAYTNHPTIRNVPVNSMRQRRKVCDAKAGPRDAGERERARGFGQFTLAIQWPTRFDLG